MNFLKIFEAVLGVGAKVVPIFVHNPQSQQIEAVIVTSLESALAAFGQPPKQ